MVFREGIVVLVVDEALSKFEIALIAAALIGEEEVLGKRVGFIPGISDILVWPARFLLRTTERFFGEMRQHRLRRAFEYLQSIWILGEFVRINEAAASLIERVSGKSVVDVELAGWLDRLAKCPDEPVNFLLSRFRTSDRVRARQPGQVLAEAVSGNEAVKIVFVVEVVGVVVPAAKVRPRSRHSLALAKRLEQPVLVQMEKNLVIVVKLDPERAFEQLYAGIRKDRKTRRNGRSRRPGPHRKRP